MVKHLGFSHRVEGTIALNGLAGYVHNVSAIEEHGVDAAHDGAELIGCVRCLPALHLLQRARHIDLGAHSDKILAISCRLETDSHTLACAPVVQESAQPPGGEAGRHRLPAAGCQQPRTNQNSRGTKVVRVFCSYKLGCRFLCHLQEPASQFRDKGRPEHTKCRRTPPMLLKPSEGTQASVCLLVEGGVALHLFLSSSPSLALLAPKSAGNS